MSGWKWPWTTWMERKEAQLLEREQRAQQLRADKLAKAQREAAAIMAANETARLMRESRRVADQKAQQQQENLRRDFRRQAVQDMARQRNVPPPTAQRASDADTATYMTTPYHADDPYPAWLMQQHVAAPLPGVRIMDDEPRRNGSASCDHESSRSAPSAACGDSSDSGDSGDSGSGGGGSD